MLTCTQLKGEGRQAAGRGAQPLGSGKAGAHHVQGPPDDAADDVGVLELGAALWQLDKVVQGVVLEDLRPDGARLLHWLRARSWPRCMRAPGCTRCRPPSSRPPWRWCSGRFGSLAARQHAQLVPCGRAAAVPPAACLGYPVCRLPKVPTLGGLCLGQELVDEPDAHVVAPARLCASACAARQAGTSQQLVERPHLLQLLVDGVDVLQVGQELPDYAAIGQREDLCVLRAPASSAQLGCEEQPALAGPAQSSPSPPQLLTGLSADAAPPFCGPSQPLRLDAESPAPDHAFGGSAARLQCQEASVAIRRGWPELKPVLGLRCCRERDPTCERCSGLCAGRRGAHYPRQGASANHCPHARLGQAGAGGGGRSGQSRCALAQLPLALPDSSSSLAGCPAGPEHSDSGQACEPHAPHRLCLCSGGCPAAATNAGPVQNRETRRRVRRLAPDVPEQQLVSAQEPEAQPQPQPQLDSSFFLLPAGLFVLVMVEGLLLAVSVRHRHTHSCPGAAVITLADASWDGRCPRPVALRAGLPAGGGGQICDLICVPCVAADAGCLPGQLHLPAAQGAHSRDACS